MVKEKEERVGGWFIKPLDAPNYCYNQQCSSDLFNTDSLSALDTVFLLLHGNAKNRGAAHRIAAYKTFQKLGFHTLTIDYRGYGDSIKVGDLSESSVVNDALMAIRGLRRHLGNKFKLVLYGHSLGSAIANHAAVLADREGLQVDGVLLASPMHSLAWGFNSNPLVAVIDSLLDVGGHMEACMTQSIIGVSLTTSFI